MHRPVHQSQAMHLTARLLPDDFVTLVDDIEDFFVHASSHRPSGYPCRCSRVLLLAGRDRIAKRERQQAISAARGRGRSDVGIHQAQITWAMCRGGAMPAPCDGITLVEAWSAAVGKTSSSGLSIQGSKFAG